MHISLIRTCTYLLFYIGLLTAAGIGTACVAQHEVPKFTSITSMDGLSSNTVTAILKDRYGLIWFATDDGLNKFDGTGFTVYRHNKADSTSLKSNDVSALYEDRQGRIWIGTIMGSLHLYDRRKDAFIRVSTQHTITSICEDGNGQLWAGTSQGLVFIDPNRRTATEPDPRWPIQLTQKHVHRVFRDRSRQMWVGTADGLFRYARRRFERVAYLPPDNHKKESNFVTSITQDSAGHLWIGTQDGLHRLSPDGKPLQWFRFEPSNRHSISNNMVFATRAVREHELWICTDGGLNIMDTRTGYVTRHAPDPRSPFSITNKSIRSILADASGIYWLGTYKGGVNKYDRNLTIFGLKRCDPYDPYGLSAPFVTSFEERPDGDVFVGTDDGGLNIYHRKTNLFSKVPIVPRYKSASSGLAILSLALTAPDALWIGTYQDGLFVLNPLTGSVGQFTQGADTTSLASNDIFSLTKDRNGKLWIGTNGAGVNVLDLKTKQFERLFTPNIERSRRLIPLNAYIRDILQDRKGNMWIASHGTGIAVFDPVKRQSELLDRETSGLPGNNVLSLREDREGRIWAGTGGEGLALFDPKTRRFTAYGAQEGLPSGVVNKVLQDAQGRIWVSTNEGISAFDPVKKKFTNYTAFNGLQNNTFALGAGLRTSDDLLFFGGIAGFNYLDTRSLKKASGVPPVILKDLKVGNRTITPADSGMIDADIAVAKSIRLDYKQNFSIGYAALNYTNPRQTTYRHRLVGLQQEWQEAGPGNIASYTNLSPGDYRFEVQASINDTDWSPAASIAVTVKPPFYLTIYAYLLYIAAPVMAVFLMRRRGIRRLQRKFREEEQRRETERTQELDKLKIKFLTNLSHEFRTPISLILAPVENLLAQASPAGSQPQLTAIRRNAKRLLNLVDQLLDFRKLQDHELKADLKRDDIVPFVRDACDSFSDLSQRKRIGFTFDSAMEHLLIDFDADKMERILFNLLSNAFKFTPEGGRVQLQLTCGTDEAQRHWLYIRVSDTGIGIAPEQHERIFDRFFQDEPGESVLNQGSGIGLSIVREFVQMHGGFITVSSERGKGSVFTIGLPCEAPAYNPVEIRSAEEAVEPAEALLVAPGISDEQPDAGEMRKVLIVEDNAEFRHYLKAHLEPNYQVVEACNGKEGWQKVLGHHPELIVSDIAMPEMDGISLSRKIKADKRTSHIPIILLTASTGEEQQLQGLSSGANDYLTKPFNFDILHVKINNLLLLNRLLKNVYSRQITVTGRDAEIESGDVKLLRDILSYIDENLNSTQLSVENLARHIGMSRGTLYSRVLEMSGQTPIEFIRSIKLEKAAILLEKSDMNVSQISYNAGFATPNYFTKSFKAKFNMLPSEYKALKRKALVLLFLVCSLLTFTARGDDGYRLWLKYDLIRDAALRSGYAKSFTYIAAADTTAITRNAAQELQAGLLGMTGQKVPIIQAPQANARGIVLTIRENTSKDPRAGDGYSISVQAGQTVVSAPTPAGTLYGSFALLRHLQQHLPLEKLAASSRPKIQLRMLNHWDNPEGTIERGYAGSTLWKWYELPETVEPRYRDYARANASVGINGTVVNNVNASARFLTPEYLHKVAALAAVFRQYGIKTYLSIHFAAPKTLGGLKTSDPLDPSVRKWWADKAREIYGIIPDFGGFLVKANSEGEPGPQDYGRTHADGANMLAEALEPFQGIVIWRAFVYKADPAADRFKAAHEEFVPLDGQFARNVIVQVKNGPIDFQPREPFSPIFGKMPKTPLGMEFQLTQEYLGFATHWVYEAPIFKECLDADTYVTGKGATVARVIDGSLHGYPLTCIAGVANTGSDRNWTGHPMAQANWYAFGRLAWDHALTSDAIAREWAQLTLTHQPKHVATIAGIMQRSRDIYVDYNTPLGLSRPWTGSHYAPEPWQNRSSRPDWTAVYYHRADSLGLGFDRTPSGSNALAQYTPEAARAWSDPQTCPLPYLLWFHHIPWTQTLSSGRTLWAELCHRFYTGADSVLWMQRQWSAVQPSINPEMYANVKTRLITQHKEALWWRDAWLLYLQPLAGQPIPAAYPPPGRTLEDVKRSVNVYLMR